MSQNEKGKAETVTEAADTVTKVDDTVTQSPETGTVSPVDADAEKRAGIKEVAANSEAMAVEKAEAAKAPEADKPSRPSFFMKKTDRHRVEVDVLSGKDGRIVSVSRTGLGLDFDKDFKYLRHDVAWFDFSLPTYEDMSTYRKRSSTWRRDAQQTVVDRIELRNFLLVWHLKDWSLTDDEGVKVKLDFDESGALSDECVAKVYAVNPTLVDVVLTLFEKEILLT